MFRRLGSHLNSAMVNALAALFSLSCVFPLLWMLYSSFKTNEEFALSVLRLPGRINFENYQKILEAGRLPRYFVNSLIISLVAVLFILLMSFVAGYFFGRYRFRGDRFLRTFFLIGMLIPVHALLIPVFIQFRNLGILNKRYTLLIPYIALGMPISIFLFESFIQALPIEIEEVAFLDGAALPRRIFSITLPMCLPVAATVTILAFLLCWNEFPFALVLISSEGIKTISIGLANYSSGFSAQYTQQMAALVIASLPIMVLYLAFHKQVINGMIVGAVKG